MQITRGFLTLHNAQTIDPNKIKEKKKKKRSQVSNKDLLARDLRRAQIVLQTLVDTVRYLKIKLDTVCQYNCVDLSDVL